MLEYVLYILTLCTTNDCEHCFITLEIRISLEELNHPGRL